MKKVYVVGPATGYARFIRDCELVDSMESADIVLFTGGEDINPALYKQEVDPSTYFNDKRDAFEVEAYKRVPKDKLIVGVCRGAQLACAMNGGTLVQNCNHHAIRSTHPIVSSKGYAKSALGGEGLMLETTSLHHQMMYPYDLNPDHFEVCFIANPIRSDFYDGGGIDSSKIRKFGEPEVVIFKTPNQPKVLAIQGHPEMIPNSSFVGYLNKMIDELLKEIR